MAPLGDAVAVSYTRRDHFIDRESGKPQRLEVRLTKILVPDNGGGRSRTVYDVDETIHRRSTARQRARIHRTGTSQPAGTMERGAAQMPGKAQRRRGALSSASASEHDRAHAVPLDQRIPGLFGGTLFTTPRRGGTNSVLTQSQRLQFASQFNSLSAELAAAHSQTPIPSASGAFRFAWDPELDTFVRSTESLGSMVAERAPTLGRHTGTFSFSYTHIDFNTLDGNSLNDLTFSQPAYSPALQPILGNDVIVSHLNMGLSFDTLFFTGAFGITDSIDVSLSLSMSNVRMNATVVSQIQQPNGQQNSQYRLLPRRESTIWSRNPECYAASREAPNAQMRHRRLQ